MTTFANGLLWPKNSVDFSNLCGEYITRFVREMEKEFKGIHTNTMYGFRKLSRMTAFENFRGIKLLAILPKIRESFFL